jgi:hypothetical protein
MIVKADWRGVKQTNVREYAIRFVFGGAITVIAGLIGDHWGPVVAGLFLAFPAIFPASVTLVGRHERERKAKKGMVGNRRGITTGADYAMGTAVGSLGLLGFAGWSWRYIEQLPLALDLTLGTLLWAIVAGSAWITIKRW